MKRNKTMTMPGRTFSAVLGLLGLILMSTGVAVPPPEGGFIDEAHKGLYTNHENRLRTFDVNFEEQSAPLKAALRLAMEERLLELAATSEPKRIRKVQGITAGWFDAEGNLTIGADVPDEVATEVAVYKASVARRAQVRDFAKAREYHWLVGKIDELALEYQGKGDRETMRLLRAEARALMRTPEIKPVKYGELEIAEYVWGWQFPTFIRMQHGVGDPALISFARLTGSFVGGGEWMKVQVWDEGGLPGLQAASMQRDVWANAYALRHPALKMGLATVRVEEIGAAAPRKKLIHSSRGFCYLGGVVGWFGDLTRGEVSIDPDDGFYYLSGRFEHRSTYIQAVVVEYPKGQAPDFERSDAEWRRGDPVRELIAAKDGICLMTSINGSFRGAGEEVRLIVDPDGKWRLGGRSNLVNTGAKAVVMRFKE